MIVTTNCSFGGCAITKRTNFRTKTGIRNSLSRARHPNPHGKGQTFSIAHLAPFVRVSYERHKEMLMQNFIKEGKEPDMEYIEATANEITRQEVKSAVQTIQFQ